LGSSVILGLCMVFGAIIPAIYYDFNPVIGKDTFSGMLSNSWGLTVIAGLLICIVGIIISGKAGVIQICTRYVCGYCIGCTKCLF
jgi:L-rhamnose-H+ transport protein